MLKLLTIVGARPQFIKAAAISREIKNSCANSVEELLIHTGQHYDKEMSEVFFSEMEIPAPAFNLGIGSGRHGEQTGEMIKQLEKVFLQEKPDGVIVYGDTNSTLAGALAAAKIFLPVIHIEAGLRSFNKQMPEEINRIHTDHVSTLLFSPTPTGIENLKKEGKTTNPTPPFTIDHPGIFHSGDIMYDNNIYFRKKAEQSSSILEVVGIKDHPYVLATVHRPSNTDSSENLTGILSALHAIAEKMKVKVVLPLHPRTSKILESLSDQQLVRKITSHKDIHFVPPVTYLDMINLEMNSELILTDSGGVQKEAWFMKKPVIILRDETEWTEITDSGNGLLTGTDSASIFNAAENYLNNPPSEFPAIFGSGNAAREIMEIITTTEWK
ncbi:non-hydrolyzing UDP-N-acetylglucosamine 2-epimerase [Bacteroidota bacterium]